MERRTFLKGMTALAANGVAAPGPQTERAYEMVKAFIARQVSAD